LFQEDEKSKHKEIKGETIEENKEEKKNQQTEKYGMSEESETLVQGNNNKFWAEVVKAERSPHNQLMNPQSRTWSSISSTEKTKTATMMMKATMVTHEHGRRFRAQRRRRR